MEQITAEKIDLRYVIISHAHCDHIGGVAAFRKALPDVKIGAASQEKDLLAHPEHNNSTVLYGRSFTVEPDIWVSDGDTLTVGGIKLTFLETPGHSPGSMSVVIDGCVFSGDTLFRGAIGRTDVCGCSFDAEMDSIRTKLYTLPGETVVLPGHDEHTTIEYQKKYNVFNSYILQL
ncbi:MAG: MBL fold metallo-hydrolase [Synergistes jonesii]|uniref:MBL fold metallo-hydrolase n=1 Tax=Synergistes jonesii TaxID=2754 RepID=UPI002A765928|nr:MBL fold metallo-hydrolase [Synergistes jonesii]MDY2985627.1 MBL fold metallo-hydrolase [Synergistes jonesii]